MLRPMGGIDQSADWPTSRLTGRYFSVSSTGCSPIGRLCQSYNWPASQSTAMSVDGTAVVSIIHSAEWMFYAPAAALPVTGTRRSVDWHDSRLTDIPVVRLVCQSIHWYTSRPTGTSVDRVHRGKLKKFENLVVLYIVEKWCTRKYLTKF
jgi:uncharacterized protein YaiE (UPF0345 family)